MAKRLLIKGGCVLSLDRSVGNHAEADVLVEDGVIREIGGGLRARDAEVVDATDTIVMPGFVDTHRHVWKSLFRNVGGGEDQVDPATYGAHYTADDVYVATLVGLLGALEAGITTVVDWSDTQMGHSFTEAALQAHTDAGLRTVLVHASSPSTDDGLGAVRRLMADPKGAVSPVTTVALGPADPAATGLERVEASWAAARELGLRIHVHVGSTPEEKGIVSGLAGRSLLGPDVTLVHCTNLDEADLDAIASTGTGVSLTPAREMTGGLGAPPLQALIDRGIRPGLGVGDDTEGPGDLFAQMRAANSIQHATSFDLKLAGKGGVPNLLTTREVIKYGTVDGANAVGLSKITGSLTPGRRADILVLRADRPNIAPINDPIGAVVWGMDTSNVDWVFVEGEPLVRAGDLVADTSQIRARAIAARERLADAAGLLTGAGDVS
jgi:5-methylthioadenosine/S-adenosylhomocysteine deaminase